MNRLLEAARAAESPPDLETLKEAPVLRDWLAAIDLKGVPCLAGTVTGHPILAEGARIYTSVLMALDADGIWARSRSRWYRLDTEWPADIVPDEVILHGYTWFRREDAILVANTLRNAVLRQHGRRPDA